MSTPLLKHPDYCTHNWEEISRETVFWFVLVEYKCKNCKSMYSEVEKTK